MGSSSILDITTNDPVDNSTFSASSGIHPTQSTCCPFDDWIMVGSFAFHSFFFLNLKSDQGVLIFIYTCSQRQSIRFSFTKNSNPISK
jgi:hypothetical protein